jgi:hypothetical protein
VIRFLLLATLIGTPSLLLASETEDFSFFENRIRPVLVAHCYECHAEAAKEIGGSLRLDHAQGIQQGGQTGALLAAGKPADSLLIQALRYDGLEMPPDQPLGETIIRDFETWVEQGGLVPPDQVAPQADDSQTELWSLQPIHDPDVPDVMNSKWPRDSIDRFALAKMEDMGISPVADADPVMLVRRLYFDLIGLPPSPAQQSEFVAQFELRGHAAVRKLVDQLLSQTQFGERWGRHWLDVARYAESNGNDGLGRNPTFPHAWRYRDYVIDAINADLPYDEFIREQIAGDLMESESAEVRDRRLIATGFLAMTAKPAKAMNDNFDMDVVADQIDVITRGIMGLSVSCARCHDHKFDPVPMQDYYALAGIFTSTETMWGVAGHEKLTAPPTDLHVLKTPATIPPPEGFVETVIVLESATGIPKKLPASKWKSGTPLAMGVRDKKEPADAKINIKGEAKKLGDPVPRGFLSACNLAAQPENQPPAINPKQSGRLQLANWITHPNHPLTARVIVNRIWQHLFQRGLVGTPDDFGVYGQRPSHPQLLDHLATRFIADSWSIKQLVRAIVLSRTYQLSSDVDSARIATDPESRWLSYHSRRRLDAEALRDSMLQASGQLDRTPAQGSIIRHRDILVNLAGNLHQSSRHRSVYLCFLRSSPPPELAAFDLPSFTTVTGKRQSSTVPGQTLHLLNNPFAVQQAEAFAKSIAASTSDDAEQIQLAYHRALNREPLATEFQQATELIASVAAESNHHQALAALCQALLICNEFRYVD